MHHVVFVQRLGTLEHSVSKALCVHCRPHLPTLLAGKGGRLAAPYSVPLRILAPPAFPAGTLATHSPPRCDALRCTALYCTTLRCSFSSARLSAIQQLPALSLPSTTAAAAGAVP